MTKEKFNNLGNLSSKVLLFLILCYQGKYKLDYSTLTKIFEKEEFFLGFTELVEYDYLTLSIDDTDSKKWKLLIISDIPFALDLDCSSWSLLWCENLLEAISSYGAENQSLIGVYLNQHGKDNSKISQYINTCNNIKSNSIKKTPSPLKEKNSDPRLSCTTQLVSYFYTLLKENITISITGDIKRNEEREMRKLLKMFPEVTVKDVNQAIRFFLTDGYWKSYILDISKLRKHFPKYLVKTSKPSQGTNSRINIL